MIDIHDLAKPAVLAALYNHAHAQGLGFLHYTPAPMTVEEAARLLHDNPRSYFDYVGGRVLKVDLSKDVFNEGLYDRDNGHGAAAQAIAPLRGSAIPLAEDAPHAD